MLNISSGRIEKPQKVVIYGPEGIGKTTFAAQFPDPVFIDTEGSTYHMNVKRTEKPQSWQQLMDQVQQIAQTPGICKTLVLDTADWAEMICTEMVCNKYQKKGIEDFGYGKGYVFLQEEFGRLLNALTEVINAGMNVVMTAHAKMRKFEQPDEMGAYDRWEMKLSKQVAPMVKEWADMVLFANYKTYVVAADDKGKKHKAQGGKRVIFTAHHPCWDAKNRHGLPEELPLDYASIARCIPGSDVAAKPGGEVPPEHPAAMRPTPPQPMPQKPAAVQDTPVQPEPVRAAPTPQPTPVQTPPMPEAPQLPPTHAKPSGPDPASGVPPRVQALMDSGGVSEDEVRAVWSGKGYFPQDTPWDVLEQEGFVDGWILPFWGQIVQTVQQNRGTRDLPFTM